MKSLAFASGCRLLHLHLIENYETILLLPRFATSQKSSRIKELEIQPHADL